jgi:RNA polymerase sigma factor (sigma-70 family)
MSRFNGLGREIALSYLCLVSQDMIKEKWNASDATSHKAVLANQEDPLIGFYYGGRGGLDRVRNCLHFYLSFAGAAREIGNHDLVDRQRDKEVYRVINSDIFQPRNLKLVRERTGLESIMAAADEIHQTPEERFFSVLYDQPTQNSRIPVIDRALEMAMPLVHASMRDLYLTLARKGRYGGLASMKNEHLIDTVYSEARNGIFNKLAQGIQLTRDDEVNKFLAREELKKRRVAGEQVDRALGRLNSREREVIVKRHGLAEGYFHTLEEVGSILEITRERVRQIEIKAFRKLKHLGDRRPE